MFSKFGSGYAHLMTLPLQYAVATACAVFLMESASATACAREDIRPLVILRQHLLCRVTPPSSFLFLTISSVSFIDVIPWPLYVWDSHTMAPLRVGQSYHGPSTCGTVIPWPLHVWDGPSECRVINNAE